MIEFFSLFTPKIMKRIFITIFALLPCVIHAAMLHSQYNTYTYTSALKVFLFILSPIAYYAMSKDGNLRGLLTLGGDRKHLKQAGLLGLLVFAVILAGFAAFRPLLDESMIMGALADVGIDSGNYFLAFIYVVLVNAAVEEVFFRGFVFLTLYRMDYRRFAYIFSSLLFALYHVSVIRNGVSLPLLVLSTCALGGVGLLFNEITRRCDSIFGSLIVHMSANLAINFIGAYIFFN